MTMPSLAQAQELLAKAEVLNPGPWIAHSVNVARAGQILAAHHPALDPDRAFVLGLLHDIGRRAGRTQMRHVVDGYLYLNQLGYDEPARICLTHSFPYQNPRAVFGQWDCTEQELQMISDVLMAVQYDEYDLLFQLCDALALPEGFCLIEKRLIDVFLRYAQNGTDALVHTKWQQVFKIQRHFEAIFHCSIYDLLPGVVETTFGRKI
ncbi:MAG: HD domain-containing protein [Caldilineaceae bacterium]